MRYHDNPEATKRLLSLAQRLKVLRLAQDVTIQELAASSGVSAQTVERFEEQGQPLNFTALHAMAAILGHDLELRLKQSKD